MRKFKKKQLLGLIETLFEAHHIIKKEIDNKNYDYVVELLTDCQSAAIQIGTTIEESEGNGLNVVTFLEEYCNYVYEISLNTNREKSNIYFKRLNNLIEKVRKDIERIEVIYEIVFLPYKASMWDSLESIWIAAKNDDRCNAVVMPIPYYDKSADGSLGEMHYEGNELPSEVPIIPWQEYNMKVQMPDFIFIHNPYDNNNYVTSVHPEYYAKNLKSVCETLCYVPYFVTDDNVDFIATGKESMCATNGILYSNYVFVQSENVKSAYINAINKFGRELGYLHLFGDLNKKIISLGSPKYDKVVNSKKEDYQIPKSWMQKIENKEVILFNTTISTLLYYNEEYLDKLRNILCFFKERNDVILWWRPHPFLLTTYESMRPELAAEYKSIVVEYKKDNYGIYDDTTDFNRAIAWSDRYYGDRGSVINLYGATGKPVLISIIRQIERESVEVDHWRTGDFEPNDLLDWIEGKERWILEKTFKDTVDSQLIDGNSGKRIFEFCIKKGKSI